MIEFLASPLAKRYLAISLLSSALGLAIGLLAAGVRVNNIDVDYSLLSTFISALALLLLAVSSLLQHRQTRIDRSYNVVAMHQELDKFSLEDRDLLRLAIGAGETISDDEVSLLRRQIFLNWWFIYLQMGFATGQINRQALSTGASQMFGTRDAIVWWERAAKAFRTEATSRRERIFYQIVDDAFWKVTGSQRPYSEAIDDIGLRNSGRKGPIE